MKRRGHSQWTEDSCPDPYEMKSQIQIHIKWKKGFGSALKWLGSQIPVCDKAPLIKVSKNKQTTHALYSYLILFAIRTSYPVLQMVFTLRFSPLYSRLSQHLAILFFKWRRVNDLCVLSAQRKAILIKQMMVIYGGIYIKGQSTYYTQPFQRSHFCSNIG
jgi:hypothetical protein